MSAIGTRSTRRTCFTNSRSAIATRPKCPRETLAVIVIVVWAMAPRGANPLGVVTSSTLLADERLERWEEQQLPLSQLIGTRHVVVSRDRVDYLSPT